MDRHTQGDMAPTTGDAPVRPATPATPARRRGFDRRWLLGLGAFVAVLAFVAFAATPAFAQTPAPPSGTRAPGGAGMGTMGGKFGGNRGGFGGFPVVVAGVDTGANTITLAGVPQQINTVRVDNTVQLQILNADGTTRAAAIGDFRTGSLVRVGIGRAAAPAAGAATVAPGQGNRPALGNVAVNRLTLVPDNLASVSGVVVANNNGVYTVSTGGNLRVTVRTQGSTTYTRNNNQAATVADVVVGARIAVSGTQAADGVTAATVRVLDLSAFGQGGQGGGPRTGMMPGAPGAPVPPSRVPAAPGAPATPAPRT